MGFRDDRDAQRLRIEALERENAELRAELEATAEARDRALAALEKKRDEVADSASRFPVGSRVCVEWRGTWWDATVVEVVGPSLWRIHYDGWSQRWDEVVPLSRIAPPSASRPGRRASLVSAALVAMLVAGAAVGWLALAPSPSPSLSATPVPTSVAAELPGAPIEPGVALEAGAPVWVEWRGTWYRAVVLEGASGGGARVHYEGYSESFDETVTPERIRAR